GLLFGKLSKLIINKISLDFEGLYPILVIALMFLTFSATDAIGGNGFLAIYFCAVYLGNQDLIHKKAILKMFDGLAWLMQIVLFLTLGLLVYPSHVYDVFGIGLLISLFLILVARPLSVFISTIPFKMRLKQKLYISWVGLRGAVPIVFATYPLIAGIDKADMIFNIVFFISLSSILFQGTTLSLVANWLKVSMPENVKPIRPNEALILDIPKNTFEQIEISPNSSIIGKKIVDLAFPKTSVITMIKRDNKYLTPSGATEILANDLLNVISANENEIEKIKAILK
ncbi:MAG: potassium/proton antiporter, partial [Flavobacterium sp.]